MTATVEKTEQKQKFDLIEILVPVLIGIVTILTAAAALFQSSASQDATKADLESQKYAINKVEKEFIGKNAFSYNWQGVLEQYQEIELLKIAAEQRGEASSVAIYQQLLEKLHPLSNIFDDQYLDPETGYPDQRAFEADLYIVEATRLQEKSIAYEEISNYWSEVADQHVVGITIFAISLALLGLVSTVEGRLRWMFLIIAVLLILFDLGLAVQVWASPEPVLSEPAINAYAVGVGKAYKRDYENAMTFFNQAIAEKPDYAKAYNQRGDVYFNLSDYTNAAKDYELALENGMGNDISVNWNLSWTYYLLGRYNEAIGINARLLERDASLMYIRLDQGLIKATKGDIEGANAEYDRAIQDTVQQVAKAKENGEEVPSTLWYRLQVASNDLFSLQRRINNISPIWTQAPALNFITADKEVLTKFTASRYTQLREMVVALESNANAVLGTTSAQVSKFTVVRKVFSDDGEYTSDQGNYSYEVSDTFPSTTSSLTILIDYSSAKPNDQSLIKFYKNQGEGEGSTEVRSWRYTYSEIQTEGSFEHDFGYNYTDLFYLDKGEYLVEMYINTKLVATDTFNIE